MAQVQPPEKLHAACDECRTRKLRCSGDKPVCGKCQREKIECVYSPQKTMGRPRKRRREGEADAPAVASATTTGIHDSHLNGFTTLSDSSSFGLISPPEFADLPSGDGMFAHTQLDPDLVGIYGTAPPMTNLDFQHTPPIDPSLWDTLPPSAQTSYQPAQQHTPPSQPSMGPCTCLSLTYLTLTSLQTVPTFSFPQVVIPLRKAMATISSLIHCPICPRDPYSAIQNVSSLLSLFKAIVERVSKVLQEIDRETDRLRAAGATKPYRVGDSSPALAHLHTGTLDCPMGFDVQLQPDAWRSLVKTALRAEVEGGGSNRMPLVALLREAEERLRRWHTDENFLGEERRRVWGARECGSGEGECEGLGAEHVRRAMGMLGWS